MTAGSADAGMSPSLVLMGLRGSGKSTLGERVAAGAGLPFLDLDRVATRLLGGGSLAELWARYGEAAFRASETRALAEHALAPGAPRRVIALGGGTPTAPGAASLLRDAASRGSIVLVYLRGGPGVLRSRLAGGEVACRPTLTGAGTLEEIEEVFAARDPLYSSLAGHVIEIDGRNAEELVAELLDLIA